MMYIARDTSAFMFQQLSKPDWFGHPECGESAWQFAKVSWMFWVFSSAVLQSEMSNHTIFFSQEALHTWMDSGGAHCERPVEA